MLCRPLAPMMNVSRVISLQARWYSSGYRISAKTYKPPYLEENMSDEKKYREKVKLCMLNKQRSPLRVFERANLTSVLHKNHPPVPNKPFYEKTDIPRYGSYHQYVKEAERARRKQNKEGVFWKNFDYWMKDQKAEPKFVDIGLPYRPEKVSAIEKRTRRKHLKANRSNPQMEKTSRLRTLDVPIDDITEDWEKSNLGVEHIRRIAHHYDVYKDLFGHGDFYPVVQMDATFKCDQSNLIPVYYGNEVLPSEAADPPTVLFESDPESLWTLLLVNPDGHLEDNNAEYIHWFVGNIKGNDVTSGDTIIDYLRPIPPRGTGHHRMVLLLLKQSEEIEYSEERRDQPCLLLRDRSFKTRKLYKKLQSVLTPASLRFFQTMWDPCVQDTYHKLLDMPEPVYKFIPRTYNVLGSLRLFPHKKTTTWLEKFMPDEPVYPGGGKFT